MSSAYLQGRYSFTIFPRYRYFVAISQYDCIIGNRQDERSSDDKRPVHSDEIFSEKVFPLCDTCLVAEFAVISRTHPDLGIPGLHIQDFRCIQRHFPIIGSKDYRFGPMCIITLFLIGVLVSAWKATAWVRDFGFGAVIASLCWVIFDLCQMFQAM